MYGFVYITTNNLNGKRYLGQCRYDKVGWQTYLGSGKALARAIKKYGKKNFSRRIVYKAQTREDLNAAEIRLIAKHDAVQRRDWYNIAPGGYTTRGFAGHTHTKESNELRRQALIGIPRPKHVGEAVRVARTGHIKSPETRAKQGKSLSDNHFAAKKIRYKGRTYKSITAAANALKWSYSKARRLFIAEGLC